MITSLFRPVLPILLAVLTSTTSERASAQLVTIQTVPVGDANNVAFGASIGDPIGSVSYNYEIGKYEVTLDQYAVFLNTVAKSNELFHIVELWDSQLQFDGNVAGIARTGSGSAGDPYVYAVIGNGSRPVSNLSWFSAARFANWVNNGATASASTETGSYTLNGAMSGLISPNPSAVWRLPSQDEWFKAAYYKGGGTNAGYWQYATRSDTSPGNVVGGGSNQANYRVRGRYAVTQSTVLDSDQNYLTPVGAFTGSASSYNTFDQTGNVTEWTDGLFVPFPGSQMQTSRAAFGGSWMEDFDASSFEATAVRRDALFGALPQMAIFGFRLVKVSPGGPTPTPTPAVSPTPTPAPSAAITSVRITPPKRTITAGKSAKIMVMVANNSTQSQTVQVTFTSTNTGALPTPPALAVTVPGKKTAKQKPLVTRLALVLSTPASASGVAGLTASVADLSSGPCLVTVKAAK